MGTRYATLNQRRELDSEVGRMKTIKGDAALYSGVADKRNFEKRLAQLDTIKAEAVPPPITEPERKALEKRQEQLADFIRNPCAEINKPAMLTQHEAWGVPAGTVGKNRKWDRAVKRFTVDKNGNVVPAQPGYGAAMEWKDNQRRLHGDEEELDSEIASVERLRSHRRPESMAEYSRAQFAPGAGIAEADWKERVGEPEPAQKETARTFPAYPVNKEKK